MSGGNTPAAWKWVRALAFVAVTAAIGTELLAPDKSNIRKQYQRYAEATKKFQAAHAAVFGGRPSISDLFVSRKRRWRR